VASTPTWLNDPGWRAARRSERWSSARLAAASGGPSRGVRGVPTCRSADRAAGAVPLRAAPRPRVAARGTRRPVCPRRRPRRRQHPPLRAVRRAQVRGVPSPVNGHDPPPTAAARSTDREWLPM
jgi:hypothetical protein